MKKVIVIGGGAAGMMAAATLCEQNQPVQVTLLERNPSLGHKVIISGGGRCNVTTGNHDLREVMKQYPRGARFLKTAMYAFPPQELYRWMEAHGVPLKIEADGRVFPKSNNGRHIVRLFEKLFDQSEVQIRFRSPVQSVEKQGNTFHVHLEDESLSADALILCAGGQAYRHTGSQGDGYAFAEALGHSITKLGPSLTALRTQEEWVTQLAGVSFPEVKLRLMGDAKHEFTGPILFTHRGVTGPAVFALSSQAAYEILEKNRPATLHLDFHPNLDYDTLARQLEAIFQASPKKRCHNSLAAYGPKSFIAAIAPDKPNHELSKKDKNKLVESLKNTPLTVIGRMAGDEFVTAGGVDIAEVDAKTMESKLCPGLFFAGEILNMDGFTGGYNLQAAWATGRLAGLNAIH